MNIDECFQLGYVIKRHGLSGEVNIFLDVDFPQEYQELESVFVEINDKLIPFFIDSLILKGNKAIVRFEDVNTVEGAEELKGKRLYLPISNLPQLDEGQFYFHEVIGYQVVDVVAGAIGEVTDIYSSPQQDLLAVDHQGKEILIPVIDDIVRKADHNKKELQVTLPEGLLDIYLD